MNKQANIETFIQFRKVEIVAMDEILEEVFLMGFNKIFDFLPGQVIGITDNPDLPARMYSIASGDKDPLVRVLFDVKPSGYLTPRLANMKAGDSLFITKPYGSFTCDGTPACWIAAGTGIAPFLSMLLSGNTSNKTLIHGARFLDSFYFSEIFEAALSGNYIRCCSGEKKGNWFKGRVTDYLNQQKSLSRDIKYYLCGRAEMVVDTRDILISKGVPYDMIMAEIYF